MPLIVWDGSLSIGVQSIDAQHRVLIEILNELHDAMMRDEERSVTAPLVKKLLACTRDHFFEEEALMESASYAGLDAHRCQNRELTRKLDHYMLRFEGSQSDVNMHLVNFLRDWLINHIRRIGRYSAPIVSTHLAPLMAGYPSNESCPLASKGVALGSDARS